MVLIVRTAWRFSPEGGAAHSCVVERLRTPSRELPPCWGPRPPDPVTSPLRLALQNEACTASLLLLAGLGVHLSPQLPLEPRVLVTSYGPQAGHRAAPAHSRQAATTNPALEPPLSPPFASRGGVTLGGGSVQDQPPPIL